MYFISSGVAVKVTVAISVICVYSIFWKESWYVLSPSYSLYSSSTYLYGLVSLPTFVHLTSTICFTPTWDKPIKELKAELIIFFCCWFNVLNITRICRVEKQTDRKWGN